MFSAAAPAPAPSAFVVAPAASQSVPAVDQADRQKIWDGIFLHIASHCYIDELAPTNYAVQWLNHNLRPDQAPEGAPWPTLLNQAFPPADTPQARQRAGNIRKRWLATPRSRIVDCYFAVPQRDDPAKIPATKEAHYAAYLPAALFTTPERVRVALVYSPGGGRGGHSRPFLTEIPGKTVQDIAAGGLGTKYRIDQYLEKYPATSPPIFLALHSNGEEYGNSATEFLTEDVPNHIASSLLGHVDPKDVVVGIEGVSSGARTIMLALRARPNAFATVGLSCMACGGVDIRKGRIGTPEEVKAWAMQLVERKKRGDLQMRFAIGSRDNQLPCNKNLYEFLSQAGLFDPTRPLQWHECQDPANPHETSCDYETDGFRTYRGELHDYHFLSRSYQEQLEFHLRVLSERHASLQKKH